MGLKMARASLPDLIVSDWSMPGMDGLEMARILNQSAETSHIPLIMLTGHEHPEMESAALKAGVQWFLRKPVEPSSLRSQVISIFQHVKAMREAYSQRIQLGGTSVHRNSLDEAFIQKVIAVLDQNLTNPDFSVDDLSDAVGMSRATLYRKMKAVVNCGPNEFIRKVRLSRAAELLGQRNAVVSQVAFEVGFSEHSYFSKCFREEFGMSPTAFQKQVAG